MDALRELIAIFGIEVDDKQLKAADKAVDGFAEKLEHFGPKLKKIGTALAEAFGAEVFKEFVKEGVEAAAHIQDLASRLDVSAEQLQLFGDVAKGAGVDLDSAAASLGKLQKNLGEAETKGGEAAAAFAKLGINATEASKQDFPDLLSDIAAGLEKLPNQNQRAAAAMQIFGRAGRELLPVLGQGREALEEMLREVDRLGSGLGDKFYADAKRAREEFEHFEIGIRSLKERALDAILPAVTLLGRALTTIVEGMLALDKSTHLVSTAMVVLAAVVGIGLAHALGVAATAAWALLAPLLATFGLPLAAAAALVWVVQDLWHLLQGGESVIGNLIEKLGGLGARNALVAQLRDLWKATREAVNDAAYALGYFFGVFAGAGKAVLGANAVGDFFAGIIKYLVGSTRLLVGFVQALEAIPKALSSGSFEPIGKAIDKAGNAVFGKGGVLEDATFATSSDVTRYGVPQGAVNEWNKHNLSPEAKGRAQASTLAAGEKYGGGGARRTHNPNLVSRAILTVPGGAGGGHSSHAVEQNNVNHVVVHTASDQPQAVGNAVGAGVATATQKDLQAALASVVKP